MKWLFKRLFKSKPKKYLVCMHLKSGAWVRVPHVTEYHFNYNETLKTVTKFNLDFTPKTLATVIIPDLTQIDAVVVLKEP